MKITETVTRDCCSISDLKPYHGIFDDIPIGPKIKLVFCKHCGQIREVGRAAREPDGVDQKDILYRPVAER